MGIWRPGDQPVYISNIAKIIKVIGWIVKEKESKGCIIIAVMIRESNSLKQKETLLKKLFSEMKTVVVALSGGVDSSLTLAVAHGVLKEKAIAAVAI